MDLEEQKFMALEGVHTWARSIILHVRNIEHHRNVLSTQDSDLRIDAIRSFQRDRHLFLISAHQLMEYGNWACSLGVVSESAFSEVNRFRNDIKALRDMNEHVIEYFKGSGHRREDWMYVSEDGTSDASSTFESKIGGKLDWKEVAMATERFIAAIPPFYHYRPA